MARKSCTLEPGVTWPPLASRQLICTVSPDAMVRRGSSARFQREWVGSAVNRCSAMRSLYRHDHLQFNQRVARKGAHADGGAHVTPLLAEHSHQKIGGAVDDRGRIWKTCNSVHIAVHADYFANLIQRPQCVLQHRKLGQGTGAGRGVAFGNAS